MTRKASIEINTAKVQPLGCASASKQSIQRWPWRLGGTILVRPNHMDFWENPKDAIMESKFLQLLNELTRIVLGLYVSWSR